MAKVIKMPRITDTMTEANIIEWHVSEGDKVKVGDVLAEVETDKATMEVETYYEGVVLHIAVGTGEVPVNSVIAIIGKDGEDYQEALEAAQDDNEDEDKTDDSKAKKQDDDTSSEKKEDSSSAEKANSSQSSDDKRIKVSPLARSMASDKGIDLSTIKGTGDGGRIIKRDIENYKPQQVARPTALSAEEAYEDIPLSQMRKTIARRLAESKYQSPHFYLTVEVDMDNIVQSRKEINARLKKQDIKLSFNDFVLKAVASALRKHPKVNSSWMGDKIRQHNEVNLGVAVAIDDGLVVPVVRNADLLPMTEINNRVRELAQKAHDRTLQMDEMQGNTFTVSNLGMFGIEEFTAIINPPDACILAVGGIQEKPVVKNGEIVPGNRMKITLSCDHRVVDGATGAQFMQTLKDMLELPAMILV